MSLGSYQPIPCVLHERLEFAVLKRQSLQIHYLDAGRETVATVLPLDVFSKHAAEWLKMQHADGREETLRLDLILSFTEQV